MATLRQKKAIKKIVENRGNVSKGMRDAGYPPTTAKNPKNLTQSKAWTELMGKYLPDADIAQKHKELLNSTTLDHMVFPPLRTPKDEATEEFDEDEPEEELEPQPQGGALKRRHKPKDKGEQLSDDEIKSLLLSVNCVVRKIVHGDMARHVYFWAADNRARKDALDMAYKLKGHYAPEKKQVTGDLGQFLLDAATNRDRETKSK